MSTVVLNLIINGLPSILLVLIVLYSIAHGFKPYYKWITFNTEVKTTKQEAQNIQVLNLIINGLPSILRSYGTTTKEMIARF